MHLAIACLLIGSSPVAPHDARDTSLAGRYVEARSASVFAGPCHFNGEYTTQGREAVFALAFDSGTLNGVSLDGLTVVAAVSADSNLADRGAHRSSVIYLPRDADEAQRGALIAALRERSGADLGDVREVRSASVDVVANDDGFGVRVDGVLELTGRAMPDRACCSMPQNVWYAPLVPLDSRLVGYCERLQLSERALGQEFSRSGENSAFVGHFRF